MFSLNTKHQPGARTWVRDNAIRVNGQQHPYVRNSRHEAQRGGIPVAVTGIVVPVGADDITIKQQPTDVGRGQAGHLAAVPRQLDELALLDKARTDASSGA